MTVNHIIREGERVTRFVMGNVTGFSVNTAWNLMANASPVIQRDENLNFIRRYHYALASWVHYVLTGSTFSHGFAMSMFVLEAADEYPFGFRDPENDLGANLRLAFGLLGLWGVVEAMKRA